MNSRRTVISYLFILVLSASHSLFSTPAHAQPVEVEFDRIRIGGIVYLPTHDTYIFRDSESFEEIILSRWPKVDGLPPPRVNFTDSLVIGISHALTLCYSTGGDIERITRDDSSANVFLGHLYNLMPVCLADMPRGDFVRVAKSDIPDDLDIHFVPPEAGYDVEPRQWYPLRIDNAWSFSGNPNLVEVIDDAATVADRTWYRVTTIDCDGEPCNEANARWLAWTADHYLLQADLAFSHIDTLYPTSPRSIFTVDVAMDCTLTSPWVEEGHEICSGNAAVEIYLWQGGPDPERRLYLQAALGWRNDEAITFSFHYGLGPNQHLVQSNTHLMGAIIDGEHIGETDAIRRALTSREGPSTTLPAAIDIFPHPAGTEATIVLRSHSTGPAEFAIFDLLGRLVAVTELLLAGNGAHTFPFRDLADVAPGVYLLRITDSGGSRHTRTVVVGKP